jgi:hypothetical protein
MNKQTRRTRRLAHVAVAGVALASLVGSSTTVDATGRNSFHGRFSETADGQAVGYDIHGVAGMRVGHRGTVVWVVLTGLDPAKDYGSHLHNGSCASGGGGHYQDVEGGAVTPPNELWVTTSGTIVESNRHGVAFASGSASWTARTTGPMTTAQSVIVHEPGGVRIACANLR